MYIDLSNMNSGFCDRLRQVTFCIAYERLQNKNFKVIEIYEKKNAESPYFISELITFKNYYIKNVKKKQNDVLKMTPFNSEINIENCKKFNKTKINNQKLLKKWKETYQEIKPKKNVILKLNKLKKIKNYISIHIRLTDKLLSFKDYLLEIPSKDVTYKRQFSEFCNNLKFMIPKKCKYIYISSDENVFKNEIKTFLGDKYKIIENNNKYNIKKLRQTSGKDFIFDLFVMSKSNLIISSTGGNVPYTSNLISGFKQSYIKWSKYRLKYLLFHKIRVIIFYLRKIFKLF